MIEPIVMSTTEDVEGHFLPIDTDGQVDVPTSRVGRIALTDDDDVEGHVLDLDVERRR